MLSRNDREADQITTNTVTLDNQAEKMVCWKQYHMKSEVQI